MLKIEAAAAAYRTINAKHYLHISTIVKTILLAILYRAQIDNRKKVTSKKPFVADGEILL